MLGRFSSLQSHWYGHRGSDLFSFEGIGFPLPPPPVVRAVAGKNIAAAVLATKAGLTLVTEVRGFALPIVFSLLCYRRPSPLVLISQSAPSSNTLHRIVY